MYQSDDAFATMLLTMALSPNRAEYARPLSTSEFRKISERVAASSAERLGGLMGVDISGLMQLLDLSEEEAYRVFTLLNRGVQLTYALEGFESRGIEAASLFDPAYPERLRRRMDAQCPPALFYAGNPDLLRKPALAILGISGVKTTQDVRAAIHTLVRFAGRNGYAVLTGGELGVSRVAAGFAREFGVELIDVVGGGLLQHVQEAEFSEMLSQGRALALSLEHPESLFTIPHAILRNKVLFSLAEAAFVFNTDGKRGETDAIKNRLCDWIYAYSGCSANHALIARGATGVALPTEAELAALSVHWKNSRTEQISLFDLL